MSPAEEKPAIDETLMNKIVEQGRKIMETRMANTKAIEARFLSGNLGHMRAQLLIDQEFAGARDDLAKMLADEMIREMIVKPLTSGLFGGLLGAERSSGAFADGGVVTTSPGKTPGLEAESVEFVIKPTR